MKNTQNQKHKNTFKTVEKTHVELVHPTKEALKRAIEKSYEKNKEALEILSKR